MGDTVIIRHQRARDFTILDNAQVRDQRLSWKARGLIAYLLSLPEGWQLRISHLVTQAPDGRHSTRTGLAELQKFGYLVIERERGALGRFERTTWTVIQSPTTGPAPRREPEKQLRPKGWQRHESDPSNAPQSENQTVAAEHHDPENRIVEKWIGTTEEPTSRRTTTTDDSAPAPELMLPRALESAEVVVVQGLVSTLQPALAQQVLDELAGAMSKPGHIRTSRVAFLRSLVKRVREGGFHPSLGIQVAAERKRRVEQTKAEAEQRAEHEHRQKAANSEQAQRTGKAALAEISRRLGFTPGTTAHDASRIHRAAMRGGGD